jgi:hypothetical protein
MRAVQGFVVLVGAIALNAVLIRALFDADYLGLYLSYGALASLVAVVFTLAWGDAIERHTGLISANPFEYVGSYLLLATGLGEAWGALIAPGREEFRQSLTMRAANMKMHEQLRTLAATPGLEALTREVGGEELLAEQPKTTGLDLPRPPIGVPVVDAVVSMIIVVGLYVALAAWVLLVAPAQYFVYLVAGAPAREALASPRRLWLRVTPGETEFATDSKLNAVPEDASESGFTAKPVTFTAALAAVLLFALDQII